ncbi:MAG: hypothetical protein U0892_05105 [Pirellulales bacterium]
MAIHVPSLAAISQVREPRHNTHPAMNTPHPLPLRFASMLMKSFPTWINWSFADLNALDL